MPTESLRKSEATPIGSTGSILLAGRTVIVNGETPGTDFPVGVNIRREVEQFAKCCIENTIPDASGRSVRHTMAVIEAARLSAEWNAAVELTELE
jgi:predicted dehydrogenase